MQTLTKTAVSALALIGLVAAPAMAAAQSTVPMAQTSAPHGSQDLGPADNGPSDMGANNMGSGDMGSGDMGPGDRASGDMAADGMDHGNMGSDGGRDPSRYVQRGYDASPPSAPAGYDRNHATRPQDREYARAYWQWRQQRDAYDYAHCVQKHRTGTAVGAVLGGIAGAVIGSNAAPRWDRSGGAFAGGALGAVAGGAIGSTTGGVCPPPYGYGPGAYYGAGYGPGFYGSAIYGPGFYGPRVFVGGPVFGFRVGPRWGWRHRYWRRW